MAIPQDNYSTSRAKMQVVPVKRPRGYDIVQLLERDIPVREWLIPDLLPIGLTLFAAAPKMGKSITMLTLALQTAVGQSGIDGSALYLALDDSDEDRYTERSRDILEGIKVPHSKMEVWFDDVCKLDEGLLFQFKQHLDEHPDTKLVLIDVWANIAPKRGSDNIYQEDYQAMKPLQSFAKNHKLAIVVLHHTRKKKDLDDWANNINGSNGLQAAVDTVWYMDKPRGEQTPILHVRGRDIREERALRVGLGDMYSPWVDLSEPAAPPGLSVPDRVLALLDSVSYPMAPRQIHEALADVPLNTVQRACKRLLYARKIQQSWYGLYASLNISQVNKTDIAPYIPPNGHDVRLDTSDASESASVLEPITGSYESHKTDTDKNVPYVEHVRLDNFINPETQECLDILGEPWGEIENYRRHVAHYIEVGSPPFTLTIGNQSLTRKGPELMKLIKWLIDGKAKTMDGWEGQQYASRVLKTLGTL